LSAERGKDDLSVVHEKVFASPFFAQRQQICARLFRQRLE